jgi:hypothetical protein
MYTYKRFDKPVGGSGFFSQLGKLVKPGRKIRTESGLYKTFSRAERGKQFRFFNRFRNKSTKNLTGRMNYMNQRIAGKRQKVEGYATKLEMKRISHHSAISKIDTKYADKIKTAQAQGNPTLVANLQKQQQQATEKAKKLFDKQAKKLTKKVTAAQARLTKKLDRYSVKQVKYKKMMDKKIYKSQKRLEKGFTKTCKNLLKTPTGKGKSPLACLQAYSACKKQSGLNLNELTSCVNAESAKNGFPLDLQASAVTGTMTKLANKHFIRRFKRGRHLREIERLSSGTGAKMTAAYDESKKTLYSGRHLTAQGANLNKIGTLSKERLKPTYYQSMSSNYSPVQRATPGASPISYSPNPASAPLPSTQVSPGGIGTAGHGESSFPAIQGASPGYSSISPSSSQGPPGYSAQGPPGYSAQGASQGATPGYSSISPSSSQGASPGALASSKLTQSKSNIASARSNIVEAERLKAQGVELGDPELVKKGIALEKQSKITIHNADLAGQSAQRKINLERREIHSQSSSLGKKLSTEEAKLASLPDPKTAVLTDKDRLKIAKTQASIREMQKERAQFDAKLTALPKSGNSTARLSALNISEVG